MKRLHLTGLAALITSAILFSGCASTAHIEKDDNTDFSRYKTFAWVDDGEKTQKQNNITENNIRRAVNAELQKEGWQEVKSRPDVYLSYDVLVEKSQREKSEPVYSRPYTRTFYNAYTRRFVNVYYPSQFLGYDRQQFPVKEGTITISMIDARTDKTVWQGWTTEEVNSKNLTSREIQNSIRSIFRKFDLAKN